eukprot:4936649-Alexandrium_andersonii.AAC.1
MAATIASCRSPLGRSWAVRARRATQRSLRGYRARLPYCRCKGVQGCRWQARPAPRTSQPLQRWGRGQGP